MNEFKKLWNIIKRLRGPEGCPWDKQQGHKELLPYLIEEVYEIANALEKDNIPELKEELGDLLFIILSYICIGEEKNLFSLQDVIGAINKKMVERHPHVFDKKRLETADDVLAYWHKLKDKERREKNISLLDNVPENISAIIRAKLIQERASRVGFDWKNAQEALLKVKEEIKELEQHLDNFKNVKNLQEEIGDLLFAIINVSRILKINPEKALIETIKKFTSRFQYIEDEIRKQGKNLYEVSLDEMESLWQESKKKS